MPITETKLKTALLGGTFNPVHLGHVHLFHEAYEKAGIQRLVLIPAYLSNFKRESHPVSFEDRAEMLRLAIEDYHSLYPEDELSIEVSLFEGERKGISYTSETIKAFFDELPKNAFALTNADDKNGMVMVQNTKAHIATYSLKTLGDFKGKVLEDGLEGMLMEINNREVNVQFIGRFNAYNLLAVYGTACLLGKDPEDILLILSTLRPVSGRFDTIRSPKGYTAIVDYAHTPDALTNVLNAIHEVRKGNGQIITVVGAGGNRDKGKRPLMAQEAVRQSDRVIITSDNPRFEEPQSIIDDMLSGLKKADLSKVISIIDRKEAIRTACLLAHSGDVILIAGKGHENYQEIKGVKHHFDDKEILKAIFDNEQ